MIRDTSEFESTLWRLLPHATSIIPMTGIGFGILVKFQTFYLKVYNDMKLLSYNVSGYLYNKETAVFDVTVPYYQLEMLTSQLRKDDHLRVPITITWQAPGQTYRPSHDYND